MLGDSKSRVSSSTLRCVRPRTYAQVCPVALALDAVGDRWALLIVRELVLGPRRFGQLLDALPGCGTDVLTSRLRSLEETGVLLRLRDAEDQRAVSYELTEDGRGLIPVLCELARWGMPRAVPPDPNSFRSIRIGLTALGLESIPGALAGVDGLFELRVGGEVATVQVSNDRMTIIDGPAVDPVATVWFSDQIFYAFVAGVLDISALPSDQLQIQGDIAAARTVLRAMGVPASPRRRETQH